MFQHCLTFGVWLLAKRISFISDSYQNSPRFTRSKKDDLKNREIRNVTCPKNGENEIFLRCHELFWLLFCISSSFSSRFPLFFFKFRCYRDERRVEEFICGLWLREIFYSGFIHLVLSETWRSLEKKMKTDNRYFPPKTKGNPWNMMLGRLYVFFCWNGPFAGDIYHFFCWGGSGTGITSGIFFCCVSDGTSNCSLVLKSWNGLWFFTQKSEPPPPVGMTL